MTADQPETTTGQWDCDAYGPTGTTIGALCFFAAPGKRMCDSAADCTAAMTGARQRVHERIKALAARGDPMGTFLLEEFPDPEMMLNGTPEADACPNCPECGHRPERILGPNQAFCGNGECRIIMWDPKKTRDELCAEGPSFVDLTRPEDGQ
jgi:hypothetical protein